MIMTASTEKNALVASGFGDASTGASAGPAAREPKRRGSASSMHMDDDEPTARGARPRFRRDTHHADGTFTRKSRGAVVTAAGIAARAPGESVFEPGGGFDEACAFARLVRWTYRPEQPPAPIAAPLERKLTMSRKPSKMSLLAASGACERVQVGGYSLAADAAGAQACRHRLRRLQLPRRRPQPESGWKQS